MSIEYKNNLAAFVDVVSVEEAEGLLEWLQTHPSAKVELAKCSHLHPANLQVLLAAGTIVSSWPNDAKLSDWLKPALQRE